MEQVIVNIKDISKRQFFLELLQEFDFVEIVSVRERTPEQQEFVEGVKSALQEVEMHLKGEKHLQNAKDFLDEL